MKKSETPFEAKRRVLAPSHVFDTGMSRHLEWIGQQKDVCLPLKW